MGAEKRDMGAEKKDMGAEKGDMGVEKRDMGAEKRDMGAETAPRLRVDDILHEGLLRVLPALSHCLKGKHVLINSGT